jgi:hypothetical protein
MKGIYLKQLCLRGIDNEDASITFKKGANIISGPSNTGKTFIFELIEYMLGRSALERRVKESRAYQEIYLELADYNGFVFTLKSDFEGGDFHKYECSLDSITANSEYLILKRDHSPGKEDTLSSYILKKCNLYGSLIRTNANGKKRELSLRDLRILHLVDELRVPTKESPFLTGQYISKTVEENVLKLLVTGIDDSAIIESIPDKVLANKNGRLELLSELVGVESLKIKDSASEEEVIKQKDALSIYDNNLRDERDQLVYKLKTIGNGKQLICTEIAIALGRMEELERLYQNSFIVEKQYISDAQRLRSTIEAGEVLSSLSSAVCPVCDSNIETDTTNEVSNISISACAEHSKIDGLLDELSKSKSLFKNEIIKLDIDIKEMQSNLDAINHSIENDIQKEYKRLTDDIDTVQEKFHEINLILNSYEVLDYLELQKSNIKSIIDTAPSKKRSFDSLNNSNLYEIANEMAKLLKLWGYPDISSISYGEDKKDFILSGENRNLAGKGFRAISYSSFLLSLMRCSVNSNYRFGFCMIDSPLVTYRKPDVPEGEEISEDMALSFLHSLGNLVDDYQVIIIENEDVPNNMEASVKHIHFTRNINVGRYGFIAPTS